MSEPISFAEAQIRIKNITKTPKPQELLKLYALYKQATSGDALGNRPSVFEVRARAKFDAWNQEKGLAPDEAEAEYVALVIKLEPQYS